jgi:predicted nucleic acid-binding protein
VAVVVFDADVLIAYLGRDDANHSEAVERMRLALAPGPDGSFRR